MVVDANAVACIVLPVQQGHTIGAAISGSGGRTESEPEQVQQQPQQPYHQQQDSQLQQSGMNGPCQFELKQFLECSQSQYDLSLCQGFNEALRECRVRYGQYLYIIHLIRWLIAINRPMV